MLPPVAGRDPDADAGSSRAWSTPRSSDPWPACTLRNVRQGLRRRRRGRARHSRCDIADGEFMVLVGPSGCGKIARCCAWSPGSRTITDGEIAIGDRVVNELEPADRDIAMVFQNYALYPHMSVFDNMAYGLKIRKHAAAPRSRSACDKAAEILRARRATCSASRAQLSGGQRQRVAMGRAIVREPAVFLFDEPLSNLDAKLRAQMRLEIQKLHRELGITTLYVTHDQVEAMTLARPHGRDERRARSSRSARPTEVYQRPATTFVAGFIGSPADEPDAGPGRRRQLHGRRPAAAAAAAGAAQRRADPGPAARACTVGRRRRRHLGTAGGCGRDPRRRAAGLRPPGRNAVHCAHRRHAAAAQARRTRAAARAGRALALVRRRTTGTREVA